MYDVHTVDDMGDDEHRTLENPIYDQPLGDNPMYDVHTVDDMGDDEHRTLENPIYDQPLGDNPMYDVHTVDDMGDDEHCTLENPIYDQPPVMTSPYQLNPYGSYGETTLQRVACGMMESHYEPIQYTEENDYETPPGNVFPEP